MHPVTSLNHNFEGVHTARVAGSKCLVARVNIGRLEVYIEITVGRVIVRTPILTLVQGTIRVKWFSCCVFMIVIIITVFITLLHNLTDKIIF